MTTTFFAPPEAFRDGRVALPADEARHATRVLRHREGDEIVVVDGAGGRHRVRLTALGRDTAEGEVLATQREVGEPLHRLTIGLGVLKNAARFETFVEKAVELGVTEIVPLHTARTERERLKASRLHNLMVAAMKQSGRSRLPALREAQPLGDVLAAPAEGLRLLAHEAAPAEAVLLDVLARAEPAGAITLLVGPEGGFSDEEVAQAERLGWRLVSLGPRRLRAETAAITAAAAVMLTQP